MRKTALKLGVARRRAHRIGKPMLERLPSRKESPLDVIDASGRNYYFQFTLNDYDAEKIEPRVPPLEERIETFKRLAKRIGRDRVVWRFDPLILSDSLTVAKLLEKVERLGDRLAAFTSRLVFAEKHKPLVIAVGYVIIRVFG